MMPAQPLPHYATLGLSVWMTRGDGEYFTVEFVVEKLPEVGGVEALLEAFLADAAEQGMFPLSEAQYAHVARMVLAEHGRRTLGNELLKDHGTPDRYRAFLENYHGRADGDA